MAQWFGIATVVVFNPMNKQKLKEMRKYLNDYSSVVTYPQMVQILDALLEEPEDKPKSEQYESNV